MREQDIPFASSPVVRRRMQAVRGRDTAAELAVRRRVHAAGLRYRVDVRPDPEVPRRADLVFPREKVAVFIDGCFWHGCEEHGRRRHDVNGWYWPDKIRRNVERDADTTARLGARGWVVVRVWEHEPPGEAAARIEAAVRARRGRDRVSPPGGSAPR